MVEEALGVALPTVYMYSIRSLFVVHAVEHSTKITKTVYTKICFVHHISFPYRLIAVTLKFFLNLNFEIN